MPNLLSGETSPYLRQHQNNPVNWYPWGKEALTKAKQNNMPIFLSIGYASCHWCHVMAHESFEDTFTANILNEKFISIKVDREERPDLDDIYMQAVVLLTGQGGWPMSVFLTPELKPFYGGTYFPPTPHQGMPSFNQVLKSVIDAWENNHISLINNAKIITDAIQSQLSHAQALTEIPIDLDKMVHALGQNYDWRNGGWGHAPKFPQAMVIEFLIQRAQRGNTRALEIVEHVLDRMAHGGMYDLVGGGFHRYSTDSDWLVPHFEKMLYDNAQLAQVYLHGFALTGNRFFRQVAVDTLSFIQREMTHPKGGFISSLDADTAEGEGRYYTWRLEELQKHLSNKQFHLLQSVININQTGNFKDGLNIFQFKKSPTLLAEELNITKEDLQDQLQDIFIKLRNIRAERKPPSKDEKIITAWNALAIIAFSEAGLYLELEDLLDSARNAANFILEELKSKSGQLKRSWNLDKANQPATLADYAGLILALRAVYEINFSPDIFQEMRKLFTIMQKDFTSGNCLYFDAASKVHDLIVRPQYLQDNAVPSGNALAVHAHWLFANYDHSPTEHEQMIKMAASVNQQMKQYPTGYGYWLKMLDLLSQETKQIALISEGELDTLTPFLKPYRGKYRPASLIASKFASISYDNRQPSLLDDRPAIDGQPTAYVCQAFTCQQPTTEPADFISQIDQMSKH